MNHCEGCGKELETGEKVIEVARTWLYCQFCALAYFYGEDLPEAV